MLYRKLRFYKAKTLREDVLCACKEDVALRPRCKMRAEWRIRMEKPKKGLHLGREIAMAANQFRRVTDRIIERRVGLTAAQANTLHYIMDKSRTDVVYQKDIEKYFGLRSPSVTGMLKQLEAKGLITRETDCDDARLKRTVLTKEARKIEEKIRDCIFGMEDAISDCLTEDERQEFLSLIKKVSEEINRKDREEHANDERK